MTQSWKKIIPIWIVMKILTNRKNLIGLVISLLVFSVYFYTLAPTVTLGDAGDFMTTAYELGVAHPPGYPLHAILGHLFIRAIPFGGIGGRVNLMEAVIGTATVFVVYQIIYQLTKNIWAAATGALFLGFSSTFWAYSIAADVFVLNCLFAALLIYLILNWRERVLDADVTVSAKAGPLLYFFVLVYGLALTNHLTIILLAPAFIFFIFLTKKQTFWDFKKILVMLLLFGVGLLPYLYLPWTAATNRPQMNWDDPTTFYRFKRLVLRADYGTGNLASDTAAVSVSKDPRWQQIPFFIWLLSSQFVWVGLILGVVGLVWIFLVRNWHLLFFPIGIFFSAILFLLYTNWEYRNSAALSAMERFTLVSDVILAILAGLGAGYLNSVFLNLLQDFQVATRWIPKRIRNNVGGLFVTLGVIPLFIHFQGVNLRGETLFLDYAKLNMDFAAGQLDLVKDGKILPQPQRIIFLTKGDILNFTTNYAQVVEKHQPELVLINYEMMTYDWYLDQLRERNPDLNIPFARLSAVEGKLVDLIDANIDHFQINIPEIDYGDMLRNYTLLPKGSNYWVLPKGSASWINQAQYIEFNERIFSSSPLTEKMREDTPKYNERYAHTWWAKETAGNYMIFRSNLAQIYLANGLYDQCIKEAEAAKPSEFELSTFRIYFVLGNCHEFKKDYPKALENYLLALKLKPDYADTYKNIANLYTTYLPDQEKAILYWQKFLEMKPAIEEKKRVEEILRELKK